MKHSQQIMEQASIQQDYGKLFGEYQLLNTAYEQLLMTADEMRTAFSTLNCKHVELVDQIKLHQETIIQQKQQIQLLQQHIDSLQDSATLNNLLDQEKQLRIHLEQELQNVQVENQNLKGVLEELGSIIE